MMTITGAGHRRTLLLDADGNLFPSEEPAFVASADVTNQFLDSLGVPDRYTPQYLLATSTGRNFRRTAVDLALAHGVSVESGLAPEGCHVGAHPQLTAAVLDDWVAREQKVVGDYLGQVLQPDPEVLEHLHRLSGDYDLAAVSSSGLDRLDQCFRATGLDTLIPAARRFSAEDSLSVPASKPDPAIYRHAVGALGTPAVDCLAVEDSTTGARSALGAGIATIGNLAFVPEGDRPDRRQNLLHQGACVVAESWAELARVLERWP
jgi:beta-phosphoglucomutase-like phosphatase (HAD superfamily)